MVNFKQFRSISINFSKKNVSIDINKIYEDLNNLCKNNKIYVKILLNELDNEITLLKKLDNEITLLKNYDYILEEIIIIIYYLENIEEIYPKNILKELLLLLGGESNIYSYPNFLKNETNIDLKLINFNLLNKLDKKYHDNFINSLNNTSKLKLLTLNYDDDFPSIDNYYLINNLINANLDMNEINELIELIDNFIKIDNNFEKIYENTNIFFQYLNYLPNSDILNKFDNGYLKNNRVFEIINYLYTQCDLSFDENLKLIKIINDKYKQKELTILKNKILCKLITNNTNLDNAVFDYLMEYEDSFEAIIKLKKMEIKKIFEDIIYL